MARNHFKGNAGICLPENLESLQARILAFLKTCRNPAVLEAGDDVLPLPINSYQIEVRNGRLWLDVDQGTRQLARRITSIEAEGIGTLDCTIHRFGGASGKLTFLDTARPQTAHKLLSGRRQNFAEQFRNMLHRQFTGWQIEILTSAMDLRRSFSPVFPRASLTKGSQTIAAMACAQAEEEHALLTFALIWLDHVRNQAEANAQRRNRIPSKLELCLFLPEDAGLLTAQRMRWLDPDRVTSRFFRFNEHGSAGEIDPQDLGNLDTRLASQYIAPFLKAEHEAFLAELAAIPSVGLCPELTGAISIRRNGLEFARLEQGRFLLGLAQQEAVAAGRWNTIKEFADALANANVPSAPERWLETAVRRDIRIVEPLARSVPVHGQVLTFAAKDRDLVDLLAVSSTGRLIVLELKANEDLHLPLQALDYWMRLWWHVQKGEADHLFPGISLTQDMPFLRLVAPALSFHSTHETVLRYLNPSIPVERIGINADWHTKLKVLLRLKGAERPQSHGGFDGRTKFARHKEGDREP